MVGAPLPTSLDGFPRGRRPLGPSTSGVKHNASILPSLRDSFLFLIGSGPENGHGMALELASRLNFG